MMRKWIVGALLLLTALLLLASCGRGRANTLTILAGSELRDLEPLFEDIRRETGIQLEMTYIGTLDGAEQLISGAETDLAWFSHGKYITLLQGAGSRVVAQEKIMLSPVILGVKESKAQAWGWVGNPDITWQTIAALASDGELRYAMTNPASSNSGFTALVGVASALSGAGEALQVGAIDNVALQEFFRGQTLTAGSSGWLAEAFVREQDRLDGMINYESVLLQLNASNELSEKLHLVYPKEGIITADYPLMLINGEKREQYETLVAYLRTPEFQQKLMEETQRRPVIPQVPLSNAFPDDLLVELPFPSNLEVIDALLFAYLDEQRIPSHAFFVLDVSGSMEGERLAQLQQAINNLTGVDTTLTGQFARFRNREQITLIPFSGGIEDVTHFTIENVDVEGASMEEIRQYVDGLVTGGDTSIYSSLQEAYRLAAEANGRAPDYYYSIVLMSDGENTRGASLNDFLRYYAALPDDIQQIPTFTVLFGNSDSEEMNQVAEATGGRVFDATSESLAFVFKQIRGYQ
jgi:Ca-activated chloride channel family protein